MALQIDSTYVDPSGVAEAFLQDNVSSSLSATPAEAAGSSSPTTLLILDEEAGGGTEVKLPPNSDPVKVNVGKLFVVKSPNVVINQLIKISR